jgi:DNA (cytosine-5)-methyltransferase 1
VDVRALSLFSGAGGMDLGFDRAGITAVAHCEIDPKAQSVLRRHWPDVPVIEDVREVTADVGDVELVHGGFPCQDISVAGNRAGLAGDRSGLWWEFHRILGEMRPRWCVIENVAGLLSSNGGRDLGSILGALGDLGYGYAYRVLDARYFGVPQRRRRVFIVGHLGGRGAAEILLEPEGVRRDPAPGREAGQVVAALTANGVGAGGGPDDNSAQAGHLIPQHTGTVTTTRAKGPGNTQVEEGHVIGVRESGKGYWMQDHLAGPLRAEQGGSPSQVVAFNGFNGMDMQPSTEVTPTVRAQHIGAPQVLAPTLTAYNLDSRSPQSEEQQRIAVAVAEGVDLLNETTTGDLMPTVRGGAGGGNTMPHALVPDLAVRRLTPRECERLMGWPDDWTRYADDGAEIANSHRYRMCGNGVVGPVAEWIGRRIATTTMEGDR